jgi:hypothetical protein
MRALLLLLLIAVPSCKAEEKKPAPAEPAAAPRPFVPPGEAAAPPPTEPAAPEPTTPAEIDEARKKAMLAGKDEDVIKYCEMAGIKSDTGDGQAALGCALAACRLNQADKAKAWAAKLPKELKKQANTICMANKVVL